MNNTKISVIIPFKDKAKMTLACVKSLVKFGPQDLEILLVSNNSSENEINALKHGIEKIYGAKIIIYDQPFNYQKINNWAADKATGHYLLFLNNDTEFTRQSKGLIEKMAIKASEKNTGMTGCLLLYGDGKVIQHAGVFLQPKGMADHLYVGHKLSKVRKQYGKNANYPYSVDEDRKLTAVTGAVQLIEKSKFNEVGGYDERFIIGGGDVDLCIRLNKAGYQTYFVAGGWILHKESQSRAHKPIAYSDFYYSYLSYITAYSHEVGDKFLPKITKEM